MAGTTRRPETTNGNNPAARFGAMVRERREALGLRQDQVSLATGVGRRFIIELEAGKPTCQLGKALLVAEAVGLRLFDLLAVSDRGNEPTLPAPLDIPDLVEDLPEPLDEDGPT